MSLTTPFRGRAISDDRALTVGALYDDHGSSLFGLALVVSGSPQESASAVVEAFLAFDALGDTLDTAAGTQRRHLARLTLDACRNQHHATSCSGHWDDLVPLQRELFGLVLHGGQTYREAAAILELDPDSAAGLIRQTLLDLAESCADQRFRRAGMRINTSPEPSTSTLTPSVAAGEAPGPPRLRVTIRFGASRDAIVAVGQIDLATVHKLFAAVRVLLADGRTHVDVELDEITFLDASAATFFVIAQRAIVAAGGTLRLVCRTPQALRLIERNALPHPCAVPLRTDPDGERPLPTRQPGVVSLLEFRRTESANVMRSE